MAVDKTEPPIKVVIGIAVLSIGILITLRVLFVSYFNHAYGNREQSQMEQVIAHGGWVATASQVRQEEQRRLGGLPAAMATIARGERPAVIAPQPSTDVAALQGWSQTPRELPRTAPAPTEPAPAPAPDPVAAPTAAPTAAP